MAVAGASYTLGRYTLTGDFSDVHFAYLDGSGLKLKNAEVFGTMYLTPKLLAGLAFMYTKGAYSTGAQPNWKQINLGVDYFINRYVDFYLVDNYQRAGGSATQAWIYSLSASSTRSQNALTAGIRVKF
jgi:predicted porin